MAACLKDFNDRSLVWMTEGKHRLSKGPLIMRFGFYLYRGLPR